MLNGKNISYDNVFILFANATTYEKADGTELVIDTLSGGAGYYVSKGFAVEIRWCVDDSGDLQFLTLSGEKLTVNRGNSYIGYYKAANAFSAKCLKKEFFVVLSYKLPNFSNNSSAPFY